MAKKTEEAETIIAVKGFDPDLSCRGHKFEVGHTYKASGKDGTWVSLAEYDANNKCVGFATGCIGRDGLKPDVMYRAQGGKLVEV